MRIKLAVLTAFFLLPLFSLYGQTNYTVDQMKQMLDASKRRGQLINGGEPFHLVASIQFFDYAGKSAGKGKLDELWESKNQYRQELTVPGAKDVPGKDGKPDFRQDLSLPPRTLVEVDNGVQAWRTGQWFFFTGGFKAIDEVLEPHFLLTVVTDRLEPVATPKQDAGLECIGTAPDLQGVSKETPLAQTTYCMSPGNHLLHSIYLPNGYKIGFNDIRPFGHKFIARSIDVGWKGILIGRLHVDVLEPASDFSSLEVAIPADAQKLPFHRGENSPYGTTELKKGQPLKMIDPLFLPKQKGGYVQVKVHVNEIGTVDSAEVVRTSSPALEAIALAAAKQWTFQASYRGDKPSPADFILTWSVGISGSVN